MPYAYNPNGGIKQFFNKYDMYCPYLQTFSIGAKIIILSIKRQEIKERDKNLAKKTNFKTCIMFNDNKNYMENEVTVLKKIHIIYNNYSTLVSHYVLLCTECDLRVMTI